MQEEYPNDLQSAIEPENKGLEAIKQDESVPINFKGTFNLLVKVIDSQKSQLEIFQAEFNKIKNEIEDSEELKYRFNNFNQISGIVSDIENKWINANDFVERIKQYFEFGLKNNDIIEMSKYITMCESYQGIVKQIDKINEDFSSMDEKIKSLSQTLIQGKQEFLENTKDFNQKLSELGFVEEIQAIMQSFEETKTIIQRDIKEFTQDIQGKIEGRKVDFERLGKITEEYVDKINEEDEKIKLLVDDTLQSINKKFQNTKQTYIKQLEKGDEEIQNVFANSLKTWKDLNIKNYKNWTKFAYGFYSFNFILSALIGATFYYFYDKGLEYEKQIQILKNSSEAYQFLVQNGDFKLEKKGGNSALNFVAKQNLTISKTENGSFQITLKEAK